MAFVAPLLVALGTRAHGLVHHALERGEATVRKALKARRERAILLGLSELSDDRLHDVGLTREAVRCGIAARHAPMRTMRACRSTDPLARVQHRLRGRGAADALAPLRDSARWGEPDRRIAHERHLGW